MGDAARKHGTTEERLERIERLLEEFVRGQRARGLVDAEPKPQAPSPDPRLRERAAEEVARIKRRKGLRRG